MGQLAVGRQDPGGPVADTIADLYWLMVGLGAAVFLIFAVLLVRGLFRRSTGDPPPERTLTSRWIVGGGVVMPAAVLVVVLSATVYVMSALPSAGSEGALDVEVVGHQWYFEVTYPEAGVTTRDELHLPVGREVELTLSSADVIHSFWVPELGGKMDMLPEDTNLLVLEADETGEYIARCAEFCGLHHTDMQMRVVVEPAEQFQAWLEAQP